MCASMKLAVFMDIEVRNGCASIESGCFMDVEVRSGCTSIECLCFMDVEVWIECSADPSARRVGLQVFQRHPGVAKGDF